jgi:hypothetical protein
MKKNFYTLRRILLLTFLVPFCISSFGQTVTVPDVDGDGSDAAWDQGETWPIEAVIDVSTVDNAADLSGDVTVLWSADSIYVRVNVLDDMLYVGAGDAYNYDNVCIYFDVFNKATSSYVDTTQMYFEKNWWAAADQMGGRFSPGWSGTPPGHFAVDTADGMTGYTIELAIGWDELAKTPAVGDKLGFDVKLSDNDGVDGSAGRDQIAWRDITDGGWDNPLVWGEITLAADGSVTGQTDFTDITIDGFNERAWALIPAWPIDHVIDVSSVTNAADLSGNVKLFWTADSIYVKVYEADDDLHNGPGDAYNYDNVCIYFDAFNKATSSYVDTTQMYFEKNWWAAADQMGGRFSPGWTGTPPGHFAVDTADGHTGYTIELAIGWTEFAKTPAIGDKMGFDVKLSDNDDDGVDNGPGRDQLAWSDKTDGGWDNPSLWGEITLAADGMVTGQNEFPVAIDGDTNERGWAGALTLNCESVISEAYHYGPADLSGSFKVIWNADQVVVSAQVFDDTLYVGPSDWYNYDNIGIFFDLLKKNTSTYVDTTQFYFERHWWGADSTGLGARFGADFVSPPVDSYATVLTDTSYTIELAFNWTDYLSAAPAAGSVIGMDVKLSDNDGFGRDQMAWKDNTDHDWDTPKLFGSLTMLANGNFAVYSGPAAVSNLAAAVDGASVTLTWDAVDGVAGYNVYRGTTLVGDAITETTLTDADLDAGAYTYSVSSIDAYGIESAAKTVDVATAIKSNLVKVNAQVYPNPTTDNLYIKSSEAMESISMMTITGQVVKNQSVNDNFKNLDISELKSGIYILSVRFKDSVENYRVLVK